MSYADTTNPNAPVSQVEKWDKTFAGSTKVDHRKVTFPNRYGITLVGDLYIPKDRGDRKLGVKEKDNCKIMAFVPCYILGGYIQINTI